MVEGAWSCKMLVTDDSESEIDGTGDSLRDERDAIAVPLVTKN